MTNRPPQPGPPKSNVQLSLEAAKAFLSGVRPAAASTSSTVEPSSSSLQTSALRAQLVALASATRPPSQHTGQLRIVTALPSTSKPPRFFVGDLGDGSASSYSSLSDGVRSPRRYDDDEDDDDDDSEDDRSYGDETDESDRELMDERALGNLVLDNPISRPDREKVLHPGLDNQALVRELRRFGRRVRSSKDTSIGTSKKSALSYLRDIGTRIFASVEQAPLPLFDLPLEIVGLVLEYLSSHDLKHLALTSRRCRDVVFPRLYFNKPGSYTVPFAETYSGDPNDKLYVPHIETGGTRLKKWVLVRESVTSMMDWDVFEIVVGQLRESIRTLNFLGGEPPINILFLVRTLPHLEGVGFGLMQTPGIDRVVQVVARCAYLTSLELKINEAALNALVKGVRGLKHLRLQLTNTSRRQPNLSDRGLALQLGDLVAPSIKTLESFAWDRINAMGRSYDDALLKWLSEMNNLRRLEYSFEQKKNGMFLAAISEAAPRLVHLKITDSKTPWSLAELDGISKFTQLETLEIDGRSSLREDSMCHGALCYARRKIWTDGGCIPFNHFLDDAARARLEMVSSCFRQCRSLRRFKWNFIYADCHLTCCIDDKTGETTVVSSVFTYRRATPTAEAASPTSYAELVDELCEWTGKLCYEPGHVFRLQSDLQEAMQMHRREVVRHHRSTRGEFSPYESTESMEEFYESLGLDPDTMHVDTWDPDMAEAAAAFGPLAGQINPANIAVPNGW